jgi:hypothetical protein
LVLEPFGLALCHSSCSNEKVGWHCGELISRNAAAMPSQTSFEFVTDTCHVLNGYTLGGFEQVIRGLARPAPKRELPPRTEEPAPEDIAAAQFLFSNYWTARADDPWAKSFAC